MLSAINARHSVRRYLDTPICGDVKSQLNEIIKTINTESGLSIQLVTDEPNAFGSITATYGLLRNVRNYVALVGADVPGLNESAGYYGEKIVLHAQNMGLNTCWVAGTYKKSSVVCSVGPNERIVCVIAIGYGANQGKPHRSRPEKQLFRSCVEEVPQWFKNGLHAAMLAPTAINQQKFLFTLHEEDRVSAKATGGFYSDIDLGIAKLHFEIGAGKDSFTWM